MPGKNSIDVIGDADTDDRDDGGDGESREGQLPVFGDPLESATLPIHLLPLTQAGSSQY